MLLVIFKDSREEYWYVVKDGRSVSVYGQLRYCLLSQRTRAKRNRNKVV